MAQLTGQLTGTTGDDSFVAQINNAEAVNNSAALFNATLNALEGSDRIEGIADQTFDETPNATATGIRQSTLTAGNGNDSFVGSARMAGDSPDSGGTASSYGLFGGSLSGQFGDDRFTFSATSERADSVTAIGVSGAVVDGGQGSDSFLLDSRALRGGRATQVGNAIGAQDSTINSGADADTFVIRATAGVSNAFETLQPMLSTGVERGQINANSGNDSINISANSQGNITASRGTVGAQILGGDGADTINIEAKAQPFAKVSGLLTATAVGADSRSWVNGGEGNDAITISAEGSGNFGSSGTVSGYGVKDSGVIGGLGSDTITITGRSSGNDKALAYGVANAEVNGGAGDDVIELKAVAASAANTLEAYGAFQSTVAGGDGNDSITLSSDTTALSGPGGYGAFGSQIYGGNGDDFIRVQAFGRDGVATFSTGAATYDIQDTLIFGDAGNDAFEVGIGSGTIQGGEGNDIAILKYFNAKTMKLTAIDGGIQVSGTQNRAGLDGAWSQKILGVEKYLVGEVTYTNADISEILTV
jgi:hypothetical protein